MSDFLSGSKSYQVEALPWLSSKRQHADTVWQNKSLPTRKTEDWKYTNLKNLFKVDFFSQQIDASDSERVYQLAQQSNIQGLEGSKLVFVNGVFDSSLSVIEEQAGLELVCFSTANKEQSQVIERLMNSCVDFEKHTFAALNTKSCQEGVLVNVQARANINAPIHIVHLTTFNAVSFAVNSRVLVNLEQSASVTVIEHYFSDAPESEADQAPVFSNSLSEFIVGENAELTHCCLMEEAECVQHIAGVHTRLARSARLDSFYLALGTQLTRVDVGLTYEGEGAEAEINGVYLPKNSQHVDFHTCIEHAVPNCMSNETFRGIIGDRARAVFNGRIHIHPHAQKTEAYLSNKNLLTSNKAEVDTKPELEIYADDVRCAHGATVAQLEESSMHYLKTRGISEEEAQVMLSFGFINELINNIKLDAVAQYCRPKLAARFARDEALTRHLP